MPTTYTFNTNTTIDLTIGISNIGNTNWDNSYYLAVLSPNELGLSNRPLPYSPVSYVPGFNTVYFSWHFVAPSIPKTYTLNVAIYKGGVAIDGTSCTFIIDIVDPFNRKYPTATGSCTPDTLAYLYKIYTRPNYSSPTDFILNTAVIQYFDSYPRYGFNIYNFGYFDPSYIAGSVGEVIVNTNRGNFYTFVYSYLGNDWILRRNSSTNQWTAVAYMYDGWKYDEGIAFNYTDETKLQFGSSEGCSIKWEYLLYDDACYTNPDNIVLMPWRS